MAPNLGTTIRPCRDTRQKITARARVRTHNYPQIPPTPSNYFDFAPSVSFHTHISSAYHHKMWANVGVTKYNALSICAAQCTHNFWNQHSGRNHIRITKKKTVVVWLAASWVSQQAFECVSWSSFVRTTLWYQRLFLLYQSQHQSNGHRNIIIIPLHVYSSWASDKIKYSTIILHNIDSRQ